MRKSTIVPETLLLLFLASFLSGCVSISPRKVFRSEHYLGRQPLVATVFIDNSARYDFERRGITVNDFLDKVSEIYQKDNGLKFSYDLYNLKVVSWEHSYAHFVRYPRWKAISSEITILEKEIEEGYSKVCDTSVCIFLTGNVSMFVSAAYKLENGNLIIIGTEEVGGICEIAASKDSGRRCLILSKFPYLKRLAMIGAHEQAHLYGVKHSPDPNSIMYGDLPNTSKFDSGSFKQLNKYLLLVPH